jgi:hypothetical protein
MLGPHHNRVGWGNWVETQAVACKSIKQPSSASEYYVGSHHHSSCQPGLHMQMRLHMHLRSGWGPFSHHMLTCVTCVQINADPYGAGWMIKVKMSNKSELDSLLDAAAYEKHSEH